jgi:hypothetical protein
MGPSIFLLQRKRNSLICAGRRQNKGGSTASKCRPSTPNADFSALRGEV